MKNYLLIALPAFILSCGGNETTNDELSSEDPTKALVETLKEEIYSVSNAPIEGSNRALLIGEWKAENTEGITLNVTNNHFTITENGAITFDSDYQLSYKENDLELNDQIDHGHNILFTKDGQITSVGSINILSETSLTYSVKEGENTVNKAFSK